MSKFAFILNASVLFVCGIFVFFGLIPNPTEIGLAGTDSEEPNHDSLNETDELLGAEKNKTVKTIGFIQAVLLPGVIVYSLCYACLKMVNYSFLFWLPYYLSNKFHWSESVADQISVWYDIGGIAGLYF